MTTADSTPVVQRISSHPVTGYKFSDLGSTNGTKNGAEFEPKSGRIGIRHIKKSEVAAVGTALVIGAVFLTGGAAVFGLAMEWGVRLFAGL